MRNLHDNAALAVRFQAIPDLGKRRGGVRQMLQHMEQEDGVEAARRVVQTFVTGNPGRIERDAAVVLQFDPAGAAGKRCRFLEEGACAATEIADVAPSDERAVVGQPALCVCNVLKRGRRGCAGRFGTVAIGAAAVFRIARIVAVNEDHAADAVAVDGQRVDIAGAGCQNLQTVLADGAGAQERVADPVGWHDGALVSLHGASPIGDGANVGARPRQANRFAGVWLRPDPGGLPYAALGWETP